MIYFNSLDDSTPTIMIFHGLTGSSSEDYVQWIIYEAEKYGYRCIVMNARGCGGIKIKTRKFYSPICTDDMTQAIQRVYDILPKGTIINGIGTSLGAHLLIRYIGEQKEKCVLNCAVAISPPYNLKNDENIRSSTFVGRKIYNRTMNFLLKRLFNKNADVFDKDFIKKMNKTKTVYEFDKYLTAPSFGFDNIDEYYGEGDENCYLKDACIPLLCISSKVDPVCSIKSLNEDVIKNNDYVIICETKEGGHVAFGDTLWPSKTQYCDRLAIDWINYHNSYHKVTLN